VESPKEPDLGSSAAVSHPFHPETGTENRNPNDVTPNIGRGQSAYSGAQPVGPEISLMATSKHYSAAQPVEPEDSLTVRPKFYSEAHSASQKRSESEELESYIEAPSTRWERQHMS